MPSVLFHIIGNIVFLRLSNVASGLPDYDEQILLSLMDSEEDATGYSQRTAYNTVYEELRKELADVLRPGHQAASSCNGASWRKDVHTSQSATSAKG